MLKAIIKSFVCINLCLISFATNTYAALSGAENLYDPLEPMACVDVNAYLGQINIASIINIKPSGNLTALAEYRDSQGVLRGSITKQLLPGVKFDLLVNDIGLVADTIGQLCVTTDATTNGEWAGSITIYRPGLAASNFGDNFDWALYRPITNALSGSTTTSINTFRLGMHPNSFVANWISIGDATPGDSQGLKGELQYRNHLGQIVASKSINLLDGEIAAFGPHAEFGVDAIGTAVFVPDEISDKYYLTNARYFYDCSSGACTSFYTAFSLPARPVITSVVVAGASVLKDEISVLEVINQGSTTAVVDIDIFKNDGTLLKTQSRAVAAFGTQHIVLNSFDPNGAIDSETVASIRAIVRSGELSITSHFYQVNSKGYLEYAYSAPAAGPAGRDQVSQFNSFINHSNELEIVNVDDAPVSTDVGFFDYNGNVVWLRHSLYLPGHGTKRITLMLPRNTYGSVLIKNSHSQVSSRIYTSRPFEYTVPYVSQPSGTVLPNISGEIVAQYMRIMPLGDSITESIVGYSSYRYWLYQYLTSQGIGVDFVGNRYGVSNGAPKFTDFDQDHQGQSGARADVMLSQLPSLIPIYTPDAYLIHLGSNDIFQGFAVDSTIEDLKKIIKTIRSYNPLAIIFLAKIIPAEKEGKKIAELSSKIGALQSMSTTSSPVYIIDQFAGFNLASDSYDNKHPNDAGEQKMAGKWFNSLIEFLFS